MIVPAISATVLGSTYPKARKSHICDLCTRPIPVGEVYRRYATVQDGNICVWREHNRCTAFMSVQNEGVEWSADGFTEALRGSNG